ncbi:MAG: biopolymer transporter ExbD [Candidatus Omnitrophota bacterium]|nr:biopolymer transporter ExbD [Candidatus Omnitrophota bacterium]
MKFGRSPLKPIAGECAGIVPFVNCVLLLLTFLLLTWNYTTASQTAIKVTLPKAVTSQTVAEESVVVTITREKVVYFNEAVVSLKELALKLEGLPKDKPLLIKADRGTSLERVVEVWDICRNAGIPQVNIATTQAGE